MDALPARPVDDASGSNLHRLFVLRNIEIACIGLGIAVATGLFDLALPLAPLLLLLALIAGLNIVTRQRLKSGSHVHDKEIFIQMLLDVAGLTGIFYFTGGVSNPFVWFYLLPLMIAATILPRAHTWFMAVVTVLCYTSLFLVDVPLDSGHGHHDPASGFMIHVIGMWLGFVMSAGFVAVIIVGMAHTLRQREQRLAEAREQALRNERLAALGTLAAGAAHELGTPLGTMAILAAELENDYHDAEHADLHDKLGILRRQVDRCKTALSVISADAGADRAEAGHRMRVRAFLAGVIDHWQNQHPDANLVYREDSHAPEADILAERMLGQALVNILDNAADVSPDAIELTAAWNRTELSLEIADRGTGFDTNIHARLGNTPVTTKEDGLGLGLYLAHATLQRLGGAVTFRNREGGGSVTRITLPLLPETGNT